MGRDDFDVSTERSSGNLVVTPSGELDISTVGRLQSAIDGRLDGEGLILDLSRLAFLDTSGLQLLVELNRRAREQSFELAVVPAPPRVQRVIEVAGLDTLLPFSNADDDDTS